MVPVVFLQSTDAVYAVRQNFFAHVDDDFNISACHDEFDRSLAWRDPGIFLMGHVAWRGFIYSKPLERMDAHAYTNMGRDALGGKCIEILGHLYYLSLCDTGLVVFLYAGADPGMECHAEAAGGDMNSNVRPVAVVVKALCLFVLFNIVYAAVKPPIADMSIYNALIPGLERLPFGNASDPYTVTMDNVDAMFAAHEISAGKTPDEIRVVLVGDSSIFGESLFSDDTLSGQWNLLTPQCNGKRVKIYNLGYPHPSIIKDLIFIEELAERQPDVIVWFVTLNTVMNQYRLNPFLTGNRERALQMMETYDIPFGSRKALAEQPTVFYQDTIVEQRSFLARWLKLQMLGVLWHAAGDDFHLERGGMEIISADVKKDPNYRDLPPGSDLRVSLLLDALTAGREVAGEVPVLLVNEPIFVASGLHSDVRYNDLYPRWAYDQYRGLLAQQAQQNSVNYLDMWNAIPPEFFTDTPLHLSADGERLFAGQLNSKLLSVVCP
jgi:hypothetical protein